MSRILVIDDELSIRRLLQILLQGAGHEILLAEDVSHGLHELALHKPDMLVLDLGLPDLDGLEVLKHLREWTQLPVLVLSARPDPADKVSALDLGADDYLTKPFDSAELLARTRALLRRVLPPENDAVISLGDLCVDQANHQASYNSRAIPLTPIEFSLLAQLARHAGRVLTHAHLLNAVWGPKATDQSHYLRVHFAHLRRKLKAAGLSGELIRNEPGIGYRLLDSANQSDPAR
ncbi:response regulator transcription factor [Luteolibacter pohnpeiensis]|uniref:Response regulator transcription factor n=1 Tax=Luteolibacter pohnpeiensis TaxID=454153 RepID=A0A934S8A0_9BACT|nr:response regulator transcription factor [Luteolibacter pohnpeiensis]MBK1884576.1 response regulator transcription factor [Luteolibacter pohnpeiensis]